MQSEFAPLGFEKYMYAWERLSVADCFTQTNRCGIYILHFKNGEYYVGLAIDVVKRYSQHRLVHRDIEYVSFKEVHKEKLVVIEKQTVYELENQKKLLRNINLVSIVLGDTDLDLIVSSELQKQWMNYELDYEDIKQARFNYPDLRRKYSTKFSKLKQSRYFDKVIQVLQMYILHAIPLPCKTEYSFWSCSCLPASKDLVFSRVNIFWQEVLTIYEDEFVTFKDKRIHKDLAISSHLCKSKLFECYSIQELKRKYKSLEFTDHVYEPGGQDQQNMIMGANDFLNMLDDTKVLDAIKEFNLRLMRKGGCISNRYHCFDLADEALRTDNLDLFS